MNTLSSVGFSQESQTYVFVMAEGHSFLTELTVLFDQLCSTKSDDSSPASKLSDTLTVDDQHTVQGNIYYVTSAV